VSGGTFCQCGEADKPVAERRWAVAQRRCNHSAFNGYHRTPSEWSAVVCLNPSCSGSWRTKARYVDQLPDAGNDYWRATA
jgi:hypothetical protein